MSELISVILICAATLPVADCTRTTAIDVMTARASTPFDCLMQGQTIVAGTALADGIGRNSYLKVVCERAGRAAARPLPDERPSAPL